MTDRIRDAIAMLRALPTEAWTPDGRDMMSATLAVVEEAITYHPHHDCDCWTSLNPVLTAWGEAVLGGRDEP